MRLGVPEVRIDPVQGVEGHDGIKRGVRGCPGLERRRDHLDVRKAGQPIPGQGG
jgi:hypothetical protein